MAMSVKVPYDENNFSSSWGLISRGRKSMKMVLVVDWKVFMVFDCFRRFTMVQSLGFLALGPFLSLSHFLNFFHIDVIG